MIDVENTARQRIRCSEILREAVTRQRNAKKSDLRLSLRELAAISARNGGSRPESISEILAAVRRQRSWSREITQTAPRGYVWTLLRAGRRACRLRLVRKLRLAPNPKRVVIPIFDLTPASVSADATEERQILLAKVRYNRLLDIFLGISTYSLQSHLRTSTPDLGQLETDELYVGISKTGHQFVIPVQAKGGRDQLGAVQIEQDLALCEHLFPLLTARPVAVQFSRDEIGEVIVMFELKRNDRGEICILDERHYRLVAGESISDVELQEMKSGK